MKRFCTKIEDVYNYVQLVEDDYQFHTTWLLAVLAFVVAATGASLYVLARQWFNSTVKQEIAAAEKRMLEQLKDEIAEELDNHYRTYSFTIAQGASVYLPYEPINAGVHPSVFVRPHHPEDKYRVDILEDKQQIKITNLNHERGEETKELQLDILVLKAKITL